MPKDKSKNLSDRCQMSAQPRRQRALNKVKFRASSLKTICGLSSSITSTTGVFFHFNRSGGNFTSRVYTGSGSLVQVTYGRLPRRQLSDTQFSPFGEVRRLMSFVEIFPANGSQWRSGNDVTVSVRSGVFRDMSEGGIPLSVIPSTSRQRQNVF